MITIARLELHNWKCFEGDQVLELAPTHYAIEARHERDHERSNWLGKSSLLEAIDYALTGRLPRSCRRKVDWITRGQKMGAVEIALADGSRVRRSLSLTTSEKLWYWGPDVRPENAAMQGEAEQAIAQAMGMTADDFIATCYFRQRDMARLLLLNPSERMEMVAGWLRLGPLQQCEDAAAAALASLSSEVDSCTNKINAHEAAIADELRTAHARDLEHLDLLIADACRDVDRAKLVLEDATKRQAACAEREHLRSQVARYDAIVDQGKALAAKLEGVNRDVLAHAVGEAEEEWKRATEKRAIERKAYQEKLTIARGKFDGGCPLMGKACPVPEQVTKEIRDNRSLSEMAGATAQAADQVHSGACAARDMAQDAVHDHDREVVRLRDLRAEARRLKPAKERVDQLQEDDAVAAAAGVAEARDLWNELAAREKVLKNTRKMVLDSQKLIEEHRNRLGDVEERRRIASAGLAIFGKNGAQRVAAEDALAEIEGRACDLLSACGIELSVRIEWSREGTGLASTCPHCGAAFPRSEKVKRCTRCGAERGPNVVNKLEIVPSDVSGAAEDLAGASVQLGASAWLREDRGSRWGVAMLDEPVGAMDAANRRAFAGKLPVMLGQVGFGQSFVIAHHSSVLDSLPGRIEVVSDGKKSIARVVT